MSSYFMCMNDMIVMNNIEELKRFFVKMNFWPLWPLDDPYDQVWSKSDKVCGRRNRLPERRRKKKKRQDPSKLGDAA